MLWTCCIQYASKFGKTQQCAQDWKRSVFIPIPKKGNAKECSNYHTIALISHASKDFPGGSDGKASAYNAGDLGSIPGSGRSPGEGNGNPLQYSCLENPMDGGAWWATVHGLAKSRIQRETSLSHASKVMLKILQARLQQYVDRELPDIQARFRKGRGTRDQICQHPLDHRKTKSSRKTSTSAWLTMPKPLTIPWKKSYDQLGQHIKKQRHYLTIKVCLVKAMVFAVVVYGCESWTIKKA